MEKTPSNTTEKKSRWGLAGAILSAVIASVCCIGPLVLLLLGVGGAWAGSLTALDAYRPFFMIFALGFLGYAFFKVYYKPKAEACEVGSYCANPKSEKINKISLWVVTFIVTGLFIFPYILPLLNKSESIAATDQTERIVLQIDNMTCAACAVTVGKSLKRVDGVMDAAVSFDDKTADVVYDPGKSGIEDFINATSKAGYPSKILKL